MGKRSLALVLNRLLLDQSGAAAVVTGLLLTALVGAVGLGVETGLWFAARRDLQSIADAAALAGAFEVTSGVSGAVTAAATADAERNGFSGLRSATIAIHNPPTSGAFTADPLAVEVVVTQSQTLLLADLVFAGGITVGARAVARAGSLGDACVLALHGTQSGAVTLRGSANVNLSECGVSSNSRNGASVNLVGSSHLTAEFAKASGGVAVSGSGDLNTESTITNAAPDDDPYAGASIPAAGPCEYNNFRVAANASAILSPGTYCNGMSLGSNSVVQMSPGTYVISGGDVRINGGARVTGTEVVAVLTGTGTDIATIDINGGAIVNLSAPTSGDLAGMLIMQNRNAPVGSTSRFNGGSTTTLTGVLYLPAGDIEYTGGNTSDGSGCIRIVAQSVTFSGNAEMGNNCDGTGVIANGPQRPRLVE